MLSTTAVVMFWYSFPKKLKHPINAAQEGNPVWNLNLFIWNIAQRCCFSYRTLHSALFHLSPFCIYFFLHIFYFTQSEFCICLCITVCNNFSFHFTIALPFFAERSWQISSLQGDGTDTCVGSSGSFSVGNSSGRKFLPLELIKCYYYCYEFN